MIFFLLWKIKEAELDELETVIGVDLREQNVATVVAVSKQNSKPMKGGEF